MGFNCGIVGLPNVGKSTIFNAITKAGAESANYPFCTIEPNVGIVEVPDERVDFLIKIVEPKKTTRATMEFLDIAGLVQGASKGEGLGNKFLGHIRQVTAIAHILRCFEDENITHVHVDVDPVRDAEIVNMELILADLESVEKQLHRVSKIARGGDKTAAREQDLLEKFQTLLGEGQPGRAVWRELAEEDRKIAESFNLITTKPVLYVANVSEEHLGDEENDAIQKARELAEKEGAQFIKLCGNVESELAEMEPEEATEYLTELGQTESGLDRMIRGGYSLLNLITYFTAGVQEVRAWTIPRGYTAPQAAGVIHTDFERGFIRAEITSFEDVGEYGSMAKAKEAGKMRLEGKEYVMRDGDVAYFRFNV